ncbi:DUF1576 domain-containing protein [Candidatus Enterococcus willemsii]|uniref:DUF1576 domain-containing protein n=1 Tax=Candidatus Enterococcus willemsii TaxID=1857215 RepID=A0ABQ6Z0S2_9ENTE|nr:DUF1576 domain-containing protein [Enterococcus sp. CU12B]KAF1304630.1 hypothetical protein BAU17_10535 [Enterococcus sp. CU12B]
MDKEKKSIILQTENKNLNLKKQVSRYHLMISYSLLLIAIGLFSETPANLWEGTLRIFTSPSNLLTDYFAVGNFGSAFVNSGILTLVSVLVVRSHGATVSGPLIAAFFTVSGFSFFGKNLYNSLPIIIGVYCYAKLVHKPYSQYLLVALFGSSISPVISYLTFGTNLPLSIGIPLGYIVGILVGMVLPPLASQFLLFHQGFSLYNVGFTAGIVAMFVTSMYRLFGGEISTISILSTDYHSMIVIFLLVLFSCLFIIGFFLNRKSFEGLKEIFASSGTLVTDFVAIAEIGATMMNMSIVGFMLFGFVKLMGGTFSGPILGGVLTVVGFSAFGNHWKNSLPILIGVVLASKLSPDFSGDTFTVILSAIFGTSLAPISGYYGAFYGILAGFIHLTLVSNITYLHGGLNLYNNGFSCGFVAAFMVPLLDTISQVKRGKTHAGKRKI